MTQHKIKIIQPKGETSMRYDKTIHTFKSYNRLYDISYYIYKPTIAPVADLQISHGMCEYIERYEHFIQFLTSAGVVVTGHDHAGHGFSINTKKDLGYFSNDPFDSTLVEDLKTMSIITKKTFPELPHFLLGHSMGSFIVRNYLSTYGNDLDGVIISGTGGENKAAEAGIVLAKILAKIKGDRHRSPFLNKIFFSGFNDHLKDENETFAWLSRDKRIINTYKKDPRCNFIFTLNGFMGLLKIMTTVTKKNYAQRLPKNIPYYLFSGKEDPVGNYGKGVMETYQGFKKAGLKAVTYKLYDNGRHEMLNELNREEVYADVLNFMMKTIKKKNL